MKKNAVSVLVIVTIVLLSGCLPAVPVNFPVMNVYLVRGKSAEQIREGTKMWVAENMHLEKACIENDNKSERILICTGTAEIEKTPYMVSNNLTYFFTLQLSAVEQKFMLSFRDLTYRSGTNENVPIVEYSEYQNLEFNLRKYGPQIVSYLENK